MEVSDSLCPAANPATKLYKPNTVIQTLKFGSMSHGSDSKHQENHSNSLRSQMFHRHISDNLHNEVQHDVMTETDSPCASPVCDNDNVFTISPLVNDLSPILKERNGGSSSSNGSQHSSISHTGSSNLSPCNKHYIDSPCAIYPSCSSTKSRHHSSSPVPALQSSPGPVLFKTPGREVNLPHSRTPKDNVGFVKKCLSDSSVPDGHVINPFEDGIIDKLNLPAFSPSTFTVLSTPSTDGRAPKPFRWSIDQIAALNPADIDEMPHHQERFISPDRELEERAQKAIDQYFSNHLIAPSPWNSTSKPFTLPRTPQMGMMIVDELKGSIQKELTKKRRTQDVSCQTVLTLPLDFDIGSVLAQYMNHKSEDDVVCEDLSTSSLRRKLFFQGDGNTSFSPVKLGKSEVYQAMQEESPTVSPSKRQPTPEWERHTPLKTPSSAQFASSPINTNNSCKKYHHLRRTSSTEAEFLASPELSPINRRHSSGRVRTIRSSNEFVPVSSLCTSPIQENFSDQEFPPLPSPNMSPIRKELGASYLPENDECSDESTPHASNPRSYSSKASQFTLSPQFQTIDNATCTTSISPLALTEATAMETGAFKSCDPITDIQDYSDMEITNDNAPLPNSTNQDTGYQTASIQLTSLHTNLTSQFSSLPLRTESSIDPNDLGDSFNYSQSNPSSALDLEPESEVGGKSQADSMLSEGKGHDKVKNALNFGSSMYPDSLDVSLNPVGSSTPTKGGYTMIKQKLFHNGVCEDIDFKPETQLGSQMAIEIMRRAGEDLAKFSTVQDSH